VKDSITYQANPYLNNRLQKQLLKLSLDFDTSGELKWKMASKENGIEDSDKLNLLHPELQPLPPVRPAGIVKYNVTDLKGKCYIIDGGKQLLHCFALERWTDVGTSTVAKFASQDRDTVNVFRKALKKSIKKGTKAMRRRHRDHRKDYDESGYYASGADCDSSVGGSVMSASVATSVFSKASSYFEESASQRSHLSHKPYRARRKRG